MDFFHKPEINRRTAIRNVPMRVLALGMPRTGTNSLREALKILGFDECYHQANLHQNPQDGAMWLQALRSKYHGQGESFRKEDWDALLGHCQAVCDVPSIHFADELMDTYPEAKVILTNRNIDLWHQSVMQTVEQRYRNRLVYLLTFVDRVTWLTYSAFYCGWESMFHKDFEGHGKDAFVRHYAHVRDRCDPARLLEYEVQQGWEPLCEFLEVPVPDVAFPKGNDHRDFHKTCNALDRSRVMAVLRKIALPAFIGAGVVVAMAVVQTHRTSY